MRKPRGRPHTRPPVSRPQPALSDRAAHQANSRSRPCIASIPVVRTPEVANEQLLRGSDRPCLIERCPVHRKVGDAAGECLAETITRVEEEALTLLECLHLSPRLERSAGDLKNWKSAGGWRPSGPGRVPFSKEDGARRPPFLELVYLEDRSDVWLEKNSDAVGYPDCNE